MCDHPNRERAMTHVRTDEGRSLMAGTPANRRAIAEAKALAEASQKLGERIESRDDR